MAIDPSLLAKLKTSKNKFSRGGNSVKLKEGKTILRFLQKGSEQFWREIGVHWIKTEKDGKPVAVSGCHSEVHGTACAICDAIEAAKKGATDEEMAIIKEWRAKATVLVVALIRSGADASTEPQIVELTGTTWGKVSGTIEEYLSQEIDMLSPTEGVDFVIERVGKGLNTEYNVMVAPKSKPVPADVYERMPDLDEYIQRELFKGDEPKALRAIGNFSGISVSTTAALTGPATTARRLASSVVDDAIVEDAPTTAPDPELAEIAEEVTIPEDEGESEEDRELREMEERMAALRAKKDAAAKKEAALAAAKPAPVKPKPAAAKSAPADDPFTASNDDIDAMLASLDADD